MCLSKKVTGIVELHDDPTWPIEDEEEEDDNFLGTISTQQQSQWLTELKVNGLLVTFKIDTGMEVSAISEGTFQQLQNVKIEKTTRKLYGPAMSPLTVLGQLTVTLTSRHVSCKQNVFVVKYLKRNLLGLPAIASLNLVSRLDSLQLTAKEYNVSLAKDAKPFALHTARKVLHKLNWMESLGIISPVCDPSPWCAGMVVVPKSSGQVQICVDLKHLNKSVQREFHPLPQVENALVQLTGVQNWMSTVGFGKYHLPKSHTC